MTTEKNGRSAPMGLRRFWPLAFEVMRQIRLGHRVDRITIALNTLSVLSEHRTQCGVAGYSFDGLYQSSRIARRNQQRCDVVLQSLGEPPDTGCDHGFPEGHGLVQGVGKALVQRWHGEHIAVRDVIVNVSSKAQQMNARRHPP